MHDSGFRGYSEISREMPTADRTAHRARTNTHGTAGIRIPGVLSRNSSRLYRPDSYPAFPGPLRCRTFSPGSRGCLISFFLSKGPPQQPSKRQESDPRPPQQPSTRRKKQGFSHVVTRPWVGSGPTGQVKRFSKCRGSGRIGVKKRGVRNLTGWVGFGRVRMFSNL